MYNIDNNKQKRACGATNKANKKKIDELVSICIAFRVSRVDVHKSMRNKVHSSKQVSCEFVAICKGLAFLQLLLDLEVSALHAFSPGSYTVSA